MNPADNISLIVLTPEKILSQPDEYLQRYIIAKTDNHLKSSDTAVIRRKSDK